MKKRKDFFNDYFFRAYNKMCILTLAMFSNLIVFGILFLVHLMGQYIHCNPSLGTVEPEVFLGQKVLILSSFSLHTVALHLLSWSNIGLQC